MKFEESKCELNQLIYKQMKKNSSKERNSVQHKLYSSRSSKLFPGVHRASNSSYYTNQSTKISNTMKSISQVNLQLPKERNILNEIVMPNPDSLYKTYRYESRQSNFLGMANIKIASPLMSCMNLNSTNKVSSENPNIEALNTENSQEQSDQSIILFELTPSKRPSEEAKLKKSKNSKKILHSRMPSAKGFSMLEQFVRKTRKSKSKTRFNGANCKPVKRKGQSSTNQQKTVRINYYTLAGF